MRRMPHCYRLQGVKINDKHIEVIIRQMMQKVEVIEPGDTTFLVGEQISRDEFDEVHSRAKRESPKPAEARPVLQGITKAKQQDDAHVLGRRSRLSPVLSSREQCRSAGEAGLERLWSDGTL